mgnify:CR=1 FL=1
MTSNRQTWENNGCPKGNENNTGCYKSWYCMKGSDKYSCNTKIGKLELSETSGETPTSKGDTSGETPGDTPTSKGCKIVQPHVVSSRKLNVYISCNKTTSVVISTEESERNYVNKLLNKNISSTNTNTSVCGYS